MSHFHIRSIPATAIWTKIIHCFQHNYTLTVFVFIGTNPLQLFKKRQKEKRFAIKNRQSFWVNYLTILGFYLFREKDTAKRQFSFSRLSRKVFQWMLKTKLQEKSFCMQICTNDLCQQTDLPALHDWFDWTNRVERLISLKPDRAQTQEQVFYICAIV